MAGKDAFSSAQNCKHVQAGRRLTSIVVVVVPKWFLFETDALLLDTDLSAKITSSSTIFTVLCGNKDTLIFFVMERSLYVVFLDWSVIIYLYLPILFTYNYIQIILPKALSHTTIYFTIYILLHISGWQYCISIKISYYGPLWSMMNFLRFLDFKEVPKAQSLASLEVNYYLFTSQMPNNLNMFKLNIFFHCGKINNQVISFTFQ